MLPGIRALLVALRLVSPDAAQIYKRASSSVVVVSAFDAKDRPIGSGSGFFVGNGKVIATNFHVIEDADVIRVKVQSGKVFQTTVLETDWRNDLALLGHRFAGKPLALSKRSPKIGEDIAVIGNPEGLEFTLSTGIVSGIREDEHRKVYQITAPISPGSSGSPVLDKRGKVLGIATFSVEGKGNQNLNFSIPSMYVRKRLGASKNIDWSESQDLEKDMTKYHNDAEQNDPNAQHILGLSYYYGDAVLRDCAEAAKWFRRAAKQGHADAQSNLGELYDTGEGVSKDYTKAAKWYRRAAKQGHITAQRKLGYLYRTGEGVSQNDVESAKWYRRAAKQGDAAAQHSLGYIYSIGLGVVQNKTTAVNWYRRAAEQSHADAQYRLGLAYRNRQGVAQNYAEAVNWYRLAAGQGHVGAQNNLGVMYGNGLSVPQDYAEAVKLFRRAAKQKCIPAYFNLGVSYFKGWGVPKNNKEAYIWFSIAASKGYKKAKKYRDIAARRLGRIAVYFAQQEAERRRKQF